MSWVAVSASGSHGQVSRKRNISFTATGSDSGGAVDNGDGARGSPPLSLGAAGPPRRIFDYTHYNIVASSYTSYILIQYSMLYYDIIQYPAAQDTGRLLSAGVPGGAARHGR